MTSPAPAPAIAPESERVLILDFGSQYGQLIARRVREQNVLSQIVRHDLPAERIAALKPRGLILSGGPASVYEPGAPRCDPKLFDLGTGQSSSVLTSQGSYTVKALKDPLPLGAVPLGQARPAILSALRTFASGVAFEHWTVAKQRAALNTATCARDDLPQPAAVDLVQYLPFLRLG